MNRVIQGDCLEVMRGLPDNSIDSFVSDPPAGIAFMGKKWDSDKGGRKQWCAYMEERFAEALRVCKPGTYGLVWALPRTSHWTATALEDAGWELRDIIIHHFGSGFPKSQDIGKMIDKKLGVDRKVVGIPPRPDGTFRNTSKGGAPGKSIDLKGTLNTNGSMGLITTPATPEAKQWDGWGTALKPASEHWILVRKPIAGTIAGNVLEWGVGGLNIDGCRVDGKPRSTHARGDIRGKDMYRQGFSVGTVEPSAQGRFPANIVLSHAHDCTDDGCADGCPVKELDRQTEGTRASKPRGKCAEESDSPGGLFMKGSKRFGDFSHLNDGGDGINASRFFPKFHYYPKASTSDRSHKGQVQNNHPTVKNRELMRWLCRLVTPPGGTVLDCFAGSGSTAIACLEEGFNYVLIEQDSESVQTINDRVSVWLKENRPEPEPTIEERSKKTAVIKQLSLLEVAS